VGLFWWKKPRQKPSQMLPVAAKKTFCRICGNVQSFSRCWRRIGTLTQCTCCAHTFENAEQLYERIQPECPQCGENLEQPGFDYGLCDGCGSKYELMEGTKPNLLPNRAQREEMAKRGKVWRPQ